MDIILKRAYYPKGVNGDLLINGELVCHTIELPWLNNEKQISCIPEGKYHVSKRFTNRFGWHLLVHNVEGRSGILVHAANNALKEIKGCIAPVTTLTGEGTGTYARAALKRLMAIVSPVLAKDEEVYLIISKTQL